MFSVLFDISNSTWHQKLFIWGIYLSYLLFFISITGIIALKPEYLTSLEEILKYYVCAFLIIRFNPFVKKHSITLKEFNFDKQIAFSAGIFLLLTTAITDIANNYLVNVISSS